MPRRLNAVLGRIERLFSAFGVASITVWALSAPGPSRPTRGPRPAPPTLAASLMGRSPPQPHRNTSCRSDSARSRRPARDPFAPAVVFVPVPALTFATASALVSVPARPAASAPASASGPAPVAALVAPATPPGPPSLEPATQINDAASTAQPPTPAQPLPERRISVAGHRLSTAGLARRQVRVLESLSGLPSLATEVIRGTRFVKAAGRKYRDDCSNVLRIPYDAQGIDLFSEHHAFPDANGVRLIREKGRRITTPEVGDLVIFDDTWDRNRNGAADDPDTHAAIVVGFEAGGTVLLYNRVRAGHRIFRMNLRQPGVFRDPVTGRRLNDPLRRLRAGDPPDLGRTTGQLFARFVRVLE